jgi:hypothetical protein
MKVSLTPRNLAGSDIPGGNVAGTLSFLHHEFHGKAKDRSRSEFTFRVA